MPHVVGSIPNLINGISQQSPGMRLPSQGEASENYYPVAVEGLVPRPRTDHLAKLGIDLPAGTFTHIILRDQTEKYILAILPDGTVKVWDFDGDEKTVTDDSSGYLSGMTTPKTELRALTVADYTFIVNTKKEVAAGSATEPARPYEALIGVLAGNYGKKYQITIDGALEAEYETPDGSDASHGALIATDIIADELYDDLDAATPDFSVSPWAIGRYHSTVYLRNTSTDFTLSTSDGFGGRAMKECKGTIAKFSDLPQHGPDGFTIKVTGDADSGFDDYWVRFNKTNDANGFGVWEECVAPGSILGLDPDTMPHTLVRNPDGTFTFGPQDWDDRRCGDVATVPHPSFVGQTIQEAYFHRNRLGFLTRENYVMSEAGNFFNFFRTTLTALLDTDPIDGAASHIKVSLLNHAVPYSEILLLFSDQTQFKLDGNELLTPKTVNAKPLSELSANAAISPVVAGNSVYFVSEGASWASVTEFFYDRQIQAADDDNISSHAPAYIPAGVHRLIASPDLELLALATDGDPDAVYLYKYLWNGQEKIQSAWGRWRLPGDDVVILNMAFDRKKIVLLLARGSDTYIEEINAEPGTLDEDLDYRVNLDRSVVLDDGIHASGETTFTLPYDAPENLKAVSIPGGDEAPGVELTITDIDGDEVTVEGDYSGETVRFGIEYEARFTFSPIYHRSQDGRQAMTAGRLTILTLVLNYARSAYFRVEVTPEGRPMRTYPFTGRVLGSAENVTGSLVLDDGRLAVPIRSRQDRVTIDIVADTWRPCAFEKASWKGTWNPSTLER